MTVSFLKLKRKMLKNKTEKWVFTFEKKIEKK